MRIPTRTIRVLATLGTFCPPTVVAQGLYDERDEWYLRTPDGCRLYVTEFGVGDTLVILHGGWGAEHSYLLDALQPIGQSYRVVLYDQRGSLRSPCPDSAISVGSHIADLERLRVQLGLDQLNLVGHSMGSYLAGAYLERYPSRVRTLVLLAPTYLKVPEGEIETQLFREQQETAQRFFQRPEIEGQIRAEGLVADSLTDKQATYKWRIGFAGVNIYRVDRWRALRGGMAFYSQAAGTAAGNSMPASWNFLDDLASHSHPVTVIVGDKDFVDIGSRLYPHWFRGLANIELVVLPNAGHVAWVDQPEAFHQALMRALQKAGRGSTRR